MTWPFKTKAKPELLSMHVDIRTPHLEEGMAQASKLARKLKLYQVSFVFKGGTYGYAYSNNTGYVRSMFPLQDIAYWTKKEGLRIVNADYADILRGNDVGLVKTAQKG